MKKIEKPFEKSFLNLAFLAVFFLVFSCSPDMTLKPDENLKAYAKSEHSLNAVLKELASGAVLHGANGIDVGPDGNLYVASVNGQEIVVMNRHNGKIIRRFGPANGVLGPDDLVFGPDGTLYWTDILTGYVGRMKMDGTMLGYQYVAPGVNPITFSPDGRLFVALDFLGDGLFELDPNLINPPRPIIESSPAIPFPLGFLNAFDFGTDGYLYGPLFAAGLVIKVNVDPANPPTSDPFGTGIAQIVAVGFKNPASAKFDPAGMLTVLDQTGEVFKVDPSTGAKTPFTTLQPGLDNMVFEEDGTLFMTNNDEGWVAEILKSGQARIFSPGGMIAPMGLAVLPGSNNQDGVFVADLFNLREFNGTSGLQENIFKGYLVPEGPMSLILPMNLSADGENLVVSSWFSEGVQVFDPKAGEVIESYPGFITPLDAIRFKGDILVTDVALGGSGMYWASSMGEITLNGIVTGSLCGLATDGETVWVSDWITGNILQVGFDGKTPNSIEVIPGLENPEGLALDGNGGLLVVEYGASRLTRIDLSTGEFTTIAEGLELSGPGLGAPPSWAFDGVDVGPSGDIYVSGGGKNVIYKVRQNKYF